MRGRQAKLTHTLGIMTRATLRFGSPFPHRSLSQDLGEDSLLERLRPGRRSPELCPRGHNPQAFLSRATAVPHPLQDHLRDGRGAQRKPDNTGVAAVPREHSGRGCLWKADDGSPQPPAPGTGGCDTLVQRAGLLRVPGASRRTPVSTRGRGNGICGARKKNGCRSVGDTSGRRANH